MKNNIFTAALIGAALTLSACAYEEIPDTRSQSFTSADMNHDSQLTYGEYQAYLQMQADMGNHDAQEALSYNQQNRDKATLLKFQKLDVNRDTFVSREELDF